jgi:NAD(P)-dependent dehydrogenase (short-subunit alcohol dehydrogenase family)
MTKQSIEAIVQQTGRSPEEVRSRLVAMNPQGRFVTAAEVAYWIAALAREEASSVNGQTVVVDGGALRV